MKKHLTVTLLITFFLTFAIPCFANSESVPAGGALPPTQEELLEAQTTFDPTILNNPIIANDVRATMYGLNVTHYSQEHSMSCGPACTRMVVNYITGNSYSEQTIRNNMVWSSERGTTLGALTNYIKDHTDRYYINYYGGGHAYIMGAIAVSIKNFSSPPIMGINESTSLGFPFTSSAGHFVVINKISSDISTVNVLDPWSGYNGNSYPKSYQITDDNLIAAYNAPSSKIGVGFQTSSSELIPSSISNMSK